METEPTNAQHRHGINMESLKAISTAIDRANHLGIAIRQSPATGQQVKARDYQQMFDFSSFEEVSYLSLRTLYPDASGELIGQLARSMTETCAFYRYRKSRQARLGASREPPATRPSLPSIVEERGETSGTNLSTDIAMGVEASQGSRQLPLRAPFRPPVRQYETPTASERPSSVDSEEVRRRYVKFSRPSTESKAKSIWTRHAPYPRPPDGNSQCQWCFCPLDSSLLEDKNTQKWQYVHSPPPYPRSFLLRAGAQLIYYIKETMSTTIYSPTFASQRSAHNLPGLAAQRSGSSTCATLMARTGIVSCTHP